MKVMVLVKANEKSESGQMASSEAIAAMGKFNEELIKAGVFVDAGGLKPTSKAARVQFIGTEKSIVDGPFLESKELVGGFWIWEVGSLAEALEWVKRCPNPHGSGKFELELRPFAEASDYET